MERKGCVCLVFWAWCMFMFDFLTLGCIMWKINMTEGGATEVLGGTESIAEAEVGTQSPWAGVVKCG